MTRKGGFKNIKLGKNIYRQMKRRMPAEDTQPTQQPKRQSKKQQSDRLPSDKGGDHESS